MTPADEKPAKIEGSVASREEADNEIKAKRFSNNAIILQRAEAARKWQADHKKNGLLFPSSYDYF